MKAKGATMTRQTMAIDRTQIYFELTKPRITAMVLLTVGAGFTLAGGMTNVALLHVMFGAGLSCIGSGALNQYWERETDGLMHRTRFRPLPTRKVSPTTVLSFGAFIAIAGVAYLAATVGATAAAINAATVISYLFVYTPLKPRTPVSTLVGAIPGALPPVIGWTAASGSIDAGAAVLFGILFLWQIPHFLAIGRMHRDDYAAAGLPMLAVVDPHGQVDGAQMKLYAAALIPVSLLLVPLGVAGHLYFWIALPSGLVYWAVAMQTAGTASPEAARKLLLTSVIYLPIISAAIVVEGMLQ
ncbi:MAG: protoheme IX farnesyltransferase [Hyphomicrobiaceae bacterium]|jgi:protoheme IX farnesyltransferase